jgi:hypothetical protein
MSEPRAVARTVGRFSRCVCMRPSGPIAGTSSETTLKLLSNTCTHESIQTIHLFADCLRWNKQEDVCGEWPNLWSGACNLEIGESFVILLSAKIQDFCLHVKESLSCSENVQAGYSLPEVSSKWGFGDFLGTLTESVIQQNHVMKILLRT